MRSLGAKDDRDWPRHAQIKNFLLERGLQHTPLLNKIGLEKEKEKEIFLPQNFC